MMTDDRTPAGRKRCIAEILENPQLLPLISEYWLWIAIGNERAHGN